MDDRTAEHLLQVCQSMMKTLAETSSSIGTMQATMANVQDDVRDLLATIRGDGNGDSGLIARTRSIKNELDDMTRRCNAIQKAKEQRALIHLRGRWGVVAALLGSSALGGSVVALISWLLGKPV